MRCLIVALLVFSEVVLAADASALKPDDIRVLKKVVACSKKLAAKADVRYHIRMYAVQAINRAHETLNDWSSPSLLKWYTERLVAEKNDQVEAELLNGAMAASRGRDLHLGRIRAFLNDLDSKYKEAHKYLGYRSKRLAESFDKFVQRRHSGIARHLKPVKIRVPDLRHIQNLRPFKK